MTEPWRMPRITDMGRFLSPEMCFDVGELGMPQSPEYSGRLRGAFAHGQASDETNAKRVRAATRAEAVAPNQPFFGWFLVSGERGDMRQSPTGLYVYTEDGREEVRLPLATSTRDAVLAEFVDVIYERRGSLHDGRWALATLEVCEAVVASAAAGTEIVLSRQVAASRPFPTTSGTALR